MTPGYVPLGRATRHPVVHDVEVAVLALLVVTAAVAAESGGRPAVVRVAAIAGVGIALAALRRHRRSVLVAVIVLIGAGGVRSAATWASAHVREPGDYAGWATVVEDPVPIATGVRTVVEIHSERFQVYAFGSPGRRIARAQAGERVHVEGTRRPVDGPHPRRAIVRHVVGSLTLRRVGDIVPGPPLDRASNRVRAQLRAGAERAMSPHDAALFTGLVIGDDTRQPPSMVDDFRMAGMSHLTAVSGQNVAFALAVAGFLLRRLSRWWRLSVTLAVIAWFAVLTRMEPSVLRAATMAGLSAWGFAAGSERSPPRLLAIAVTILVLVDPFLVWSVAFWLSTGATAGVTVLAPILQRHLRGPDWLVPAMSVTIGAQLGVLLPSWLVFHRMPVLSLIANLLAVPVAGTVMLLGIPAGLVAAVSPNPLASIVMAPCIVGTRWVAVIARLAARLEPAGWLAVALWVVQVAILGSMWRRGPPSAGVSAGRRSFGRSAVPARTMPS